MRLANERILVIALIESEKGIANAESIMAVPEIDVGWLGHYDLTPSLGIPGQFGHSRFLRQLTVFLKPARLMARQQGSSTVTSIF
jgi:2-keto-3-deoxy-L-rhamnonate aldolase RhmA